MEGTVVFRICKWRRDVGGVGINIDAEQGVINGQGSSIRVASYSRGVLGPAVRHCTRIYRTER